MGILDVFGGKCSNLHFQIYTFKSTNVTNLQITTNPVYLTLNIIYTYNICRYL